MLLLEAGARYDEQPVEAVDWAADGRLYTEQQLGEAVNWIKEQKANDEFQPPEPPIPNVNTLTDDQRRAYMK